MRHGTKIAMLSGLVTLSVGLSIVVFDLSRAHAAASTPRSWMARDPGAAVNTLFTADSLTFQDHVYMPGTYANTYLPVGIKGLGTAPPKTLTYNSKTYAAGKSLNPSNAYARQNPLPAIKWTPKNNKESGVPAVQLEGLGGTKFVKNEKMVRSKKSSDPVKTNKLSKVPASKFAIKLKSETKNGKIALTGAQLRAFQVALRNAMAKGGVSGTSATLPGSLDDQLALFELSVRLRNGTPTDVKITGIPISTR